MNSAPYDGLITAGSSGGTALGVIVKINDARIAYNSNADYGTNSVGSIPFKKGDKISISSTPNTALVFIWFYENRDYSDR